MSQFPPQLAAAFRAPRLIGRGGFGAVYHAVRVADGREVALKLLTPEAAPDPVARQRLAREARAGMLLDSAHVVRVLDVELEETPYLVMEFVEGPDLEAYLASRGGRLELAEATGLMRGILGGLGAAHEAGMLHRDLKPGNVLLTAEGVPRLTDFGLVRFEGLETLTRTGTIMGTPRYMAPEQMMGQGPGPHWDLYAAAVIHFEMLAGRPPFDAASLGDLLDAKRRGLVTGLREEGVAAPGALDRLLRRCLDPDPARRPESVAVTLDLLEAAMAHADEVPELETRLAPEGDARLPDAAPRTRPEPAPGSPGRGRPRGWGVGLAAAGVVALGVALGGGPGGRAPAGGAPAPRELSPEARARLRELRTSLEEDPALQAGMDLEGGVRHAATSGLHSAAFQALEGHLQGEGVADLARELAAAPLDPPLLSALGGVLLPYWLMGRAYTVGGALEVRRSALAEELEQVYRRGVRVSRIEALSGVFADLRSHDLTPRTARERAAVEALGGTWSLVRGRLQGTWPSIRGADGTATPTARLRKTTTGGTRFQDPLTGLAAAATLFTGKNTGEPGEDLDPDLASFPVRDPKGGPLVLAGVAYGWEATTLMALRVRGRDDDLEVYLHVPATPGEVGDGIDMVRTGFMVQIAPEVLPVAPQECRIRAVAIQPLSNTSWTVSLEDVYQQVAGSRVEPPGGGVSP